MGVDLVALGLFGFFVVVVPVRVKVLLIAAFSYGAVVMALGAAHTVRA